MHATMFVFFNCCSNNNLALLINQYNNNRKIKQTKSLLHEFVPVSEPVVTVQI